MLLRLAPYVNWPDTFPPLALLIAVGSGGAGTRLPFADNLDMYEVTEPRIIDDTRFGRAFDAKTTESADAITVILDFYRRMHSS